MTPEEIDALVNQIVDGKIKELELKVSTFIHQHFKPEGYTDMFPFQLSRWYNQYQQELTVQRHIQEAIHTLQLNGYHVISKDAIPANNAASW